MMKKIAIYGAGGMGREARWLIDDINKSNSFWHFIGYFDDNFSSVQKVDPALFLGNLESLNNWPDNLSLVIAIGNPLIKRRVIRKITNTRIEFPVLIHPDAAVSEMNVEIGEGTMVCAGCKLSVDISIGKHVLINLGSIICHDSRINDYASLMPSVNISGEVNIGEATYIGTGVKIIQQLMIGSEAVIGAGAVVVNDLPGNSVAVGVPAKVIRTVGEVE